MKSKRRIILPILIGILAIGLAFAVTASSSLAGKMIEVFYGIDIYLDDVLLDTKDANGNPVEAFIYNGTTYLPVRAISEAVGKNVQWEGKTRSVYLGKHTGDAPAVWLKDMDYFVGTGGFHVQDTLKDNLGNHHTNVIYGNFKRTYVLNDQYSRITGSLFMDYEHRSYSTDGTLKIYGDEELLYEASVSKGIEPINFSVDLSGILQLRIEFDGSGTNFVYAALGECGLWT